MQKKQNTPTLSKWCESFFDGEIAPKESLPQREAFGLGKISLSKKDLLNSHDKD